MDIGLLSKMIAELIEDHDSVSLPGLGTFVAAVVPASFSDRGFTINPPYRKLSFMPGSTEDNLLAELYAHQNSMDTSAARAMLYHYLRELKGALETRKSISLPGLGRLRATKDNNFFFVPDSELDIYADGFGLAAVSLRNTAAVDDGSFDAGLVQFPGSLPSGNVGPESEVAELEPEEVPVAVETVAASSVEPADTTGQETVPEKRRNRWWAWPVAIIFAAAIALLLFLLLAHVAPDFIDSILYSPEELQIINY